MAGWIEVRVVQFGLKSYAWFEITRMISDQNCTTRSSIATFLQPLWNHTIQSEPIFIWPSSRFVETKRVLYLLLYSKQKWCNIEQKWCDLKEEWRNLEHGWRDLEQVWLLKKKCDSWINHTAESQSDCRDHQWLSILQTFRWTGPEPHIPKRATSILSLCNGTFKDQFIFSITLEYFFPLRIFAHLLINKCEIWK